MLSSPPALLFTSSMSERVRRNWSVSFLASRLCASFTIIDAVLLQVQRCLSVNPVTYWMAALIWDTLVSLVFVTIAACIIQAFQVVAIALTPINITVIMSINMQSFILEKIFHPPAFSQVPSYTLGANFPATLLLMLLFCQARCPLLFLINSN